MGQIRKARSTPFERGSVAHMQYHPGGDARRRVLPIAFLRAVLSGADNHVGNVLGVADITAE